MNRLLKAWGLLAVLAAAAPAQTTGPAIASGETRFGQIIHAGYGDRFLVDAPADSVVCFYVAAYRSDLDPKLLLTDEQNRVLLTDDDGGIGSSAYLVGIKTTGQQFLNVAGEGTTKGRYRLKMWSRPALTLETFPSHFSGEIRRPHEVHLYQFEAAGEEVIIRVRGTESLKAHVQLVSPAGLLLRSVWANPEQRIVLRRHLFSDAEMGNTYLLIVRSWNDTTGRYTLDIAKD